MCITSGVDHNHHIFACCGVTLRKMTSRFVNLPPEILLEIFSYLTASDICSMSQVCKEFHNLIEYAESLWKKQCCSLQESQRAILDDKAGGMSWKESFQNNFGRNGIKRQWKEGNFSNLHSTKEIPRKHMAIFSADSWGEIFETELKRE